MSESYGTVLEIVAANPGINIDEFTKLTADHGLAKSRGAELINQAIDWEDVLEFDGRYWVVRQGRFAFTEFDHPKT